MKKKVVFLGFNSFREHKRGVENVIEFQSSMLNDYAYYIHYGKRLSVYKYKSLICISLPLGILWRFIVLSLVVWKIACRNGQQIFIHSHSPLMTLFLYRKTDLFTVHDALYYHNREKGRNRLLVGLFYYLEGLLYKRSRWVHFISKYAKSQSLFPLKREDYSIIYNTSNYEKQILRYKANIEEFKLRFPFLYRKPFFFSVRSIEERARIDLIIDAAQKRSDWLFVVAGKGPLLEQMRARIQQESVSNVYLLGFVSDDALFLLYSFADMVIVPAEYGEGFGLPIIESYLFNKPVIASNRCAIPEVIMDDSFLFENEVCSLLFAIEKTYSRPKEAYREYYLTRFSLEYIGKQYLELYRKCMY